MALDSFNVYHSYLMALGPLNDAECGRLLKACLHYSMTGEVPELRGNERFLFPSWQSQIDRDKEKYAAKCRKNSENVSKRWDTKRTDVSARIRRDTDDAKDKEEDKKEKGPAGPKRKASVPPSVEEVSSYCQERGNGLDPAAFVDYYAARGWKYGPGKPVADWRAAVRTWERKRKEDGQDGERYFTAADIPL